MKGRTEISISISQHKRFMEYVEEAIRDELWNDEETRERIFKKIAKEKERFRHRIARANAIDRVTGRSQVRSDHA